MNVCLIRIRLPSLLACGLVSGLIAASAFGQSNAANQAPGVSVLDCKWEKRHSSGTFYNPIPPSPSVGQSTQGAGSATTISTSNNRLPDTAAHDIYFYSIRVKNDGPKIIRSMAWDYVFTDPVSHQELGRRSLNSFEKVGLHDTKWIELRPVVFGPPKLATVGGLAKDRRSPFDEHIEIKCALYTDGTGWKAPDAEAKTCDELVRLTLHPDARRN